MYIYPLVTILVLQTLLVGCGSPTLTTYRTFGAVKISVDTAMSAWADHVVNVGATDEQQAKVRAAFQTYQAAYALAIQRAISSDAPSPADVTSAANALVQLIASFGVKVGGGV